MIRSAHSLRTLLYPVLSPHDLSRSGLKVILELHSHNEIADSVILATR